MLDNKAAITELGDERESETTAWTAVKCGGNSAALDVTATATKAVSPPPHATCRLDGVANCTEMGMSERTGIQCVNILVSTAERALDGSAINKTPCSQSVRTK